MKNKSRRTVLGSSALACLLAMFAGRLCLPARADVTLVENADINVTASLEAAAGYFTTQDTNFGAGRVDVRSGQETGDAQWQEGYLKGFLNAEYALRYAGTLYGGASGVGTTTGGDGDAGGFTDSGDGDLSTDTAFLGWRSGNVFSENLGEDAVDLSYGRQEFHVGNGFLIWDGDLDQFDKGAYWLAPRNAYERAALLRTNTMPVRADGFYLKADNDQDSTQLAGLNIDYSRDDLGAFGAMYFHVLDAATPRNFGARDGMDVLDLRVIDLRPPGTTDLFLSGEYVHQGGSGKDGSFEASGWYVEMRYALSHWQWLPTLAYRFASFSGDSNPDDSDRKDFDPFFYGWGGSWGTWYQGEITGEYLLFNSNQVNHMVHLSVTPREDLSVGALYYRFRLDKKNYFGEPVSDDDFDQEINVYVDWTINDYASVSALYGVAFPGKAAKEVFGDNQKYQLFQVALYLAY